MNYSEAMERLAALAGAHSFRLEFFARRGEDGAVVTAWEWYAPRWREEAPVQAPTLELLVSKVELVLRQAQTKDPGPAGRDDELKGAP